MRRLLPAVLIAVLAVPAAAPAATKKERRLAVKITKKIRDGQYVGTRGDGEPVDYTFCANGKYSANTGGGISEGEGWKVTDPVSTKSGFTAIIRDGSFSISIARLKGQWQVGYESFDEPAALGDVKRTSGKEVCAEL